MKNLTFYSSNAAKKVGLRFYGKRMYYRELMNQREDSFLDLWYSKPLYGKVDTNFNLVESAAAKLSLLNDGHNKEKYYALDFVADAFNAMKIYINNLHLRGKFTPGEKFFHPLQAHKGWVSTNELYRTNVETVYRGFRDTYLNASLQRKITNKSITKFDNYLPVYVEFLNNLGTFTDSPLTRSGFILKKIPLAASGLAIEIADENDASDDRVKFEKYFSDPQFSTYVDIATDFGFYVDMNMPWRLVANLESDAWFNNPALKQILDNRFEGEYTSQRMFEQYYYRPERVDYEEFKTLALVFYNTFVDKEPSFDKLSLCTKNISPSDPSFYGGGVISRKIYRRKMSMDEVSMNYNDLFWLRLYMQMRIKEMRADVSEEQMKFELRELGQRYMNMGTASTIQYISGRMAFYLKQQMAKYSITPGKKRKPLTTKRRPDIILPDLTLDPIENY